VFFLVRHNFFLLYGVRTEVTVRSAGKDLTHLGYVSDRKKIGFGPVLGPKGPPGPRSDRRTDRFETRYPGTAFYVDSTTMYVHVRGWGRALHRRRMGCIKYCAILPFIRCTYVAKRCVRVLASYVGALRCFPPDFQINSRYFPSARRRGISVPLNNFLSNIKILRVKR
jgi:hypothetical protein